MQRRETPVTMPNEKQTVAIDRLLSREKQRLISVKIMFQIRDSGEITLNSLPEIFVSRILKIRFRKWWQIYSLIASYIEVNTLLRSSSPSKWQENVETFVDVSNNEDNFWEYLFRKFLLLHIFLTSNFS